MKRGRKTLFALLLALVMTLGLAATAWATGVVPTDTLELTITKRVEQEGNSQRRCMGKAWGGSTLTVSLQERRGCGQNLGLCR